RPTTRRRPPSSSVWTRRSTRSADGGSTVVREQGGNSMTATRTHPVISADSHITEPPHTYVDFIDPAFRDRAPHPVDGGPGVGGVFVSDGMRTPVPMGLVAAAGKPPEEIRVRGVRFAELHRGGWDPEVRLADQDRDGVAAEVIYPTVGMQLCNHRDA